VELSRFLAIASAFVCTSLAPIAPVFGTIIYSGPQNLLLQGVPNTSQSLTINLAGNLAGWDTLQLSIGANSIASVGTNDIFAGAGVALASTASGFPAVTEFNLGDPYPSSPLFGSGSEVLWGNGIAGGFTDGAGYAATRFGTQGGGPAFSGWIHLRIQNSALPTASLTVIDWAYSDQVGQAISMGQIPEPSTLSLLVFGLIAGTVIRFRRGFA
jgi:hypothetical protein